MEGPITILLLISHGLVFSITAYFFWNAKILRTKSLSEIETFIKYLAYCPDGIIREGKISREGLFESTDGTTKVKPDSIKLLKVSDIL